MKVVEYRTNVPSRLEVLYLIPISDTHLCTKNCDEKKLIETIEWIRTTPNVYWLHMGDVCFSADTEILTVNGWKTYDKLFENEEVIEYNHILKRLRPANIQRKVVYKYDGAMIRILGKNIDQFITPEHRILFYRNGKPYIQRAWEIERQGGWMGIPTAGKFYNRCNNSGKRCNKRISGNAIRLLAWFITEGWLEKVGNYRRIATSQSTTDYPLYAQEIDELCKRLNYYPHKHINKENVKIWRFNGKESEKILKYYDNKDDIHRIPRNLLNQDYGNLAILFNALMRGDGTKSRNTYNTTSAGLMEDFCELCCKIGYATTVTTRKSHNANEKDLYRIYISKNHLDGIESKYTTTYTGTVWCVTVPSGFAVIRRNGKISISGNCEFINYTDPRFDISNLDERFFKDLDNLHIVQANHAIKLFKPIQDRCIGFLEGNHDEAIRQRYHLNIIDYIAGNLKTRNLSYVTIIRWTIIRKGGAAKNLIIYATHGFGGGLSEGSPINRLVKEAQDFEADVFLMGHVHKKICIDRDKLYVTMSGEPVLKEKKQLFGVCGTYYKNYENDSRSYTEKRGYSPTPTGSLKIRIEPFRHSQENEYMHLHISA